MSWEPRCRGQEGSPSAATKESGKREKNSQGLPAHPHPCLPTNLLQPVPASWGWGEGGKGYRDPHQTPCNASSSAAFRASGRGSLSQRLCIHCPVVNPSSASSEAPCPYFFHWEGGDPFLSVFSGLLSLTLPLSVVEREGYGLGKGWNDSKAGSCLTSHCTVEGAR